MCAAARFSLFSELEANAHNYGVESAVLGFASLEEVFLNVVKLSKGRDSETIRTNEANSNNRPSLGSNATGNGISAKSKLRSGNYCSSSPACRLPAVYDG